MSISSQKEKDLSQEKLFEIKLYLVNNEEVKEMFVSFSKVNNYLDFISLIDQDYETSLVELEFTNDIGILLVEDWF
jgi:hypothetical protein